jgi:hypothetical protein
VRELAGEVLVGAGLGLLVLGGGGRAVMRAIALFGGAPPAVSVGGTVTVLAAGTAAGAAGALLHALSRAGAARIAGGRAGGRAAVHIALFAALLTLVTARGLHGSPPRQAAGFWPLVLIYGVLLMRIFAWRAGARADDGTPLPAAAPAG